jgi:hypothetical protein
MDMKNKRVFGVGVGRVAAFALVAFAASISPAEAQTPRVELSGGYQYAHVPDLDLGGGWVADVTANITDVLGIVGEVSGARTSVTQRINSRQSIDVDFTLLTFMAGIRSASYSNSRVVPFMQVLGGVARGTASAGVPTAGFDVNVSETHPAIQSGGGVIVMLSKTAGIRAGVDYRAVYFEAGRDDEFRFTTTAVVAFGK